MKKKKPSQMCGQYLIWICVKSQYGTSNLVFFFFQLSNFSHQRCLIYSIYVLYIIFRLFNNFCIMLRKTKSCIMSSLPCIDSHLVFYFYFRYGHSAAHAVYVVISVLLFHFLVTGVVLATCCW